MNEQPPTDGQKAKTEATKEDLNTRNKIEMEIVDIKIRKRKSRVRIFLTYGAGIFLLGIRSILIGLYFLPGRGQRHCCQSVQHTGSSATGIIAFWFGGRGGNPETWTSQQKRGHFNHCDFRKQIPVLVNIFHLRHAKKI